MFTDRLRIKKVGTGGGGGGLSTATTGFTTSYLPATYDVAYPASGTTTYVKTGTDTNLQPNTASIEVWFNIAAASVVFLDLYPFTSHSSPYYGYHVRTNGTQVFFGFNNAGTYNSLAGGTWTASAWCHLVATFTSGAQNLYLNGTLVASGTYTGNPTWYVSDVCINGFRNLSGTDNTYSGTVALVKLYNTVMSSTTVSAHYAAGHP